MLTPEDDLKDLTPRKLATVLLQAADIDCPLSVHHYCTKPHHTPSGEPNPKVLEFIDEGKRAYLSVDRPSWLVEVASPAPQSRTQHVRPVQEGVMEESPIKVNDLVYDATVKDMIKITNMVCTKCKAGHAHPGEECSYVPLEGIAIRFLGMRKRETDDKTLPVLGFTYVSVYQHKLSAVKSMADDFNTVLNRDVGLFWRGRV